MAAAMGLVQIESLEKWNRQRIHNSEFILDELAQDTGSWYRVPKRQAHVRHTYFWCPVMIATDAGFGVRETIDRLQEKGIEVRHRYYEPLYRQPVIRELSPYPGGCPFACRLNDHGQDYRSLRLPNVEAIAGKMIGLPNHPLLTRDELNYIVHTVKHLYD